MMATRDDVTVRIDVELRAKAKELNINMSRLFEDALRDEIERRKTITQTLEDAQVHKLDIEGDDGVYVGRITGTFLGEGHDVQAYLTDDQRLIVYDEGKQQYWVHTGEVDLQTFLDGWFPYDQDVIADVMRAIGETPEIDL